jgi:hypothetical protein
MWVREVDGAGSQSGLSRSRLPVYCEEEKGVNRLLQWFMNYGLVMAILVWAATVALMAFHLKDSPWRWAFVLLSLGGVATVGLIFGIRRYVNSMAKSRRNEADP